MPGRGRKRAALDVTAEPLDANRNVKKQRQEPIHLDPCSVLCGQVLAVGEGDTGQLGLGPDIMEKCKPGKINLPPNVVQICAGGMHSVCLTSDGEVYSWGCNDDGALGRTTADEDENFEPGKVGLDVKIVRVSAGDSHTSALAENGDVYAWGTFRDANGNIGLTESGDKEPLPIRLLDGHRIIKVASGGDHLVCLSDQGEIYTCGCAEQGQLGRVAECFSQRGGRKGLGFILSPAKVSFKKRSLKIKDIWTGQYVTYARSEDGQIFSWGLNNYFQLGFADMINRYVPDYAKSFQKTKGWKEISGGQHHTVALDKDGKVYTLGRADYGRLGHGEDAKEVAEPKLVETLRDKTCVSVNSGSCVTFAVTDEGSMFAWGMGTSKQLGQIEEDDLYVPTLITGKQVVDRHGLSVSSGGQHTILLAQDKS